MKFEEWLSESASREYPELENGAFNVENQQKVDYLQLAKERGITEPDFLRLIEKAVGQIEIIKPALENLKFKISEIDPDRILLLSKGADLFLNPLKKYFEENKIDQNIECYNDHDLKGAYLRQDMTNEFIDNDFPQLSNQKVMFIDETFSVGKGALAIKEMACIANAKEVYYFALSQDDDKKSIEENLEVAGSNISPIEFEKNLLLIKNNPNFILSKCSISGNLFSKDIGPVVNREVESDKGRIVTKKLSEFKYERRKREKGKIPSPFDFCSDEEIKLSEERSRQSFLLKKILEEAIYDSLANE